MFILVVFNFIEKVYKLLEFFSFNDIKIHPLPCV